MSKEKIVVDDGLEDLKGMRTIERFKHFIKTTFPHITTEIIIFTMLASIIAFSFSFNRTATISNEISFMAKEEVEVSDVEVENIVDENQEVEFEVNDSEPSGTIVQDEQDVYQSNQICFVGDDRVVDMKNAILTDTRFIAKEAADVEWLQTECFDEFQSIANSVSVCVVSLGINDLFNVDDYIVTLNDMATRNPDIKFVFSNIGPIDDDKTSLGFTNENIELFNQKMKDGLNESWRVFDTYAYMVEKGYETTNGVQYSLDNSAGLFVWLLNGASSKNEVPSITDIVETVDNVIEVETN